MITSWYQRGKSSARVRRSRPWPWVRRLLAGVALAAPKDELDLLRGGGVGVGARRVEQGAPVGLRLGLRCARSRPAARRASTPSSRTRRSASSISACTMSASGTTCVMILPLDEQVALLLAGCDADVGLAPSPGPLTTHPMTATWIGRLSFSSASWASLATAMTPTWGLAAGRAGDERLEAPARPAARGTRRSWRPARASSTGIALSGRSGWSSPMPRPAASAGSRMPCP